MFDENGNLQIRYNDFLILELNEATLSKPLPCETLSSLGYPHHDLKKYLQSSD